MKQTLGTSKKTSTKTTTKKKSVFKKFCRVFLGLFNIGNTDKSINIESGSEYAAKLSRKRSLELSVINGWMSPNECHEELQALNKWLSEHAND